MAQAWFRFYSETLHDRKIERICRQTAEPKAVIVGAWAILLALANDSPVRGALLLTENVPLTTGDILDEMGLPPDNANRLLRCFCDLDMIHQDEGTWYVTHFGDRQYDSDNSTERVQRYRERHKVTSPDSDTTVVETLPKRFGNTPEAETDTETESDTEQIQNREERSAHPPGNGKDKDSPSVMFTALATAYRMDTTLITERTRGRLNTATKRLRTAGYTTDEIADAARFWWAEDWRGKKGSPPTDSQFFDTIAQRRAFHEQNAPPPILELPPCQE